MRKLRDRMHEDLTLRGLSAKTIDSYLRCVRKFAEHFGRSPSTLGAEEIRDFLLHLRERRVSASTFNVYAGALKFLYRVTLERPEQVARIRCMRVPMHLPTVLSGSEMSRLIAALETDKHRALVMLAYGAGLRASEACKLCIEDVDPKRMLLHIRDTKRGRERYVMLSPRLLATLRAYWKVSRPQGPQLFPGRDGQKGLTRAAMHQAIVKAARLAGIKKRAPHAAPFICHSSIGSRDRSAHAAGFARARIDQEHDGVPTHQHSARAVDHKSTRRARLTGDACIVCAGARTPRA